MKLAQTIIVEIIILTGFITGISIFCDFLGINQIVALIASILIFSIISELFVIQECEKHIFNT